MSDFLSQNTKPDISRIWIKYSINLCSHTRNKDLLNIKQQQNNRSNCTAMHNFDCSACFERSEMKQCIRWKAINYALKMKAAQILWWLRVWCIVLFLISLTRTEGVLQNAVMGLIKRQESLWLVKEISLSEKYKFSLKLVRLVQKKKRKAFKPRHLQYRVISKNINSHLEWTFLWRIFISSSIMDNNKQNRCTRWFWEVKKFFKKAAARIFRR